MNIDTTALNTLFIANLSASRAFASAYQVLLGGVPSQLGFTTLINNAAASNFGARISTSDAGPAFNQENVFINVVNALVQGNNAAAATFSNIAVGGTLAQKVTTLYNVLIPAASQTPEGIAFFTRPDGLLFFEKVAFERGVAGVDGAAIVALASILNLTNTNNIGVGNDVLDLHLAVSDGSSQLPAVSTNLIDINIADGTKYDSDDTAGSTAPSTFSPGTDNIVGVVGLFNESFTAIPGQVTAADSLDGGSGFDTFITTGSTILPQLKNVEAVEFVDVFQNKDVDTIAIPENSGVTEIKIRDSQFVGDRSISLSDQVLTLQNATFGDRGLHIPATVDSGPQAILGPRVDIDLSTMQSTQTVVLDNVGTGRAPTLDLTDSAADITELKLIGSGASSEVNLVDDDNKLATLIVSGDQNITVYNSNITSLKNVDMSSSTSGQTFTNLAAADITITGTIKADSINTGAGTDRIFATSGADFITTGAGSDTIVYTNVTQSSFATLDTIVDFNSGPNGDRIELASTLFAPNSAGLNFAGNHTDLTGAQDATVGGDGKIDYVFQQDTRTVWVDLNDDGVLFGAEDLRIGLDSLSGIAAGDIVKSGETDGFPVDTVPGDTSTTEILQGTSSGAGLIGQFEFAGDSDWYSVFLEQGEAIGVTAIAGNQQNFFFIHDNNGELLPLDIDIPEDMDSLGFIGLIAPYSGKYYVDLQSDPLVEIVGTEYYVLAVATGSEF